MTSLLLIIIYLAFISLGLPDALLGSAWPSMYQELGASVSWAGGISMIIALGTIISSLASDYMTRKIGTAKVTAISVGMTAVALFGFSVSHSFWILCLWAVPYGLGAGSVDAALNNFVALHYPARHMSWLHCMWGVGASIGPVIMSWAVAGGWKWNGGYRTIAILQVALTAALFLSFPLWKRKQEEDAQRTADLEKSAKTKIEFDTENSQLSHERRTGSTPRYTFVQLLRLRGVKEVLICFFCYCALETTTGMWAASYCTLYRGITAEQATRWASLFYLGITAGRFVCGFITYKVNDRNMIRLGQAVTAAGILLVILPFGKGTLFIGLIMIGCGCAPVYPSIIHETPQNFGADLSQSIIGIQMASAYVGTCLVPPLFGLTAQYINIGLYPYFLAVILLLMVIMSEKLHIAVKKG